MTATRILFILATLALAFIGSEVGNFWIILFWIWWFRLSFSKKSRKPLYTNPCERSWGWHRLFFMFFSANHLCFNVLPLFLCFSFIWLLHRASERFRASLEGPLLSPALLLWMHAVSMPKRKKESATVKICASLWRAAPLAGRWWRSCVPTMLFV